MKDKNPESLPLHIQHSVLSILLFNETYSVIVRNTLPLETWGSDQAISAMTRAVYDFVDTYRKCPGTLHVYELIYALPLPKEGKNNLIELVSSLEDSVPNIDVDFTMSRLEKFHRQTTLKTAIISSLDLIERGEIAKVEELLHVNLKKRLELFDPGTTLLESLTRKMQKMQDGEERDRIPMGIPALDLRGLVPTKKQLMVIGAGAKKGKSFGLIHCTKQALLHGKKVLYVTLELDKDMVSERIIQSVYALTKRKLVNRQLNRLVIRDNGVLDSTAIPDVPCLSDLDVAIKYAERLQKDGFINNNLYVKEFPMDTLTLSELNAFIDNIEMQKGFEFDELVVDYGKLMYTDPRREYRIAIGKNYEGLRTIATERNKAVVTASQLNRSAISAKRSNDAQVAEDYSIIATADLFMTYNQTDEEKDIGTARLYIANARTEEGGFEVVITQDYATAQWVLGSHEATRDFMARYDQLVKPQRENDER